MTPLSCGPPLSELIFRKIRRQMVLNHCKWDPQVEDVRSLCSYPLLLKADAWRQISTWAETLAGETLSAEEEILEHPALLDSLGLPRAIRRILQDGVDRPTQPIARIMRFDFHWTSDGWKISEVNSDVPGGFIESSAFTELFRQTVVDVDTTGNPARTYIAAVAQSGVRSVALVHATSYSDDRQVMVYLSSLLKELGIDSCLCSPADLVWNAGKVSISTQQSVEPVDAMIRFFPAEWLPNLPKKSGWRHFFRGGVTPVSNPAFALISQSKRFPLVWKQLRTQLPLWKSLLPETRDPREVPWRTDPSWVLKPAMGRVGESIGIAGVTSAKDWSRIRLHARWLPSVWAAQQKFQLLPVSGPAGDVYPVIGVYTVNRAVAGVYARISRRPLIDHLAQDIAVLIPRDAPATLNVRFQDPEDCRLVDRSTLS